jgi:hypothetical protein
MPPRHTYMYRNAAQCKNSRMFIPWHLIRSKNVKLRKIFKIIKYKLYFSLLIFFQLFCAAINTWAGTCWLYHRRDEGRRSACKYFRYPNFVWFLNPENGSTTLSPNVCSYCLPYKRMWLTCTAWVESLNTRDDGRWKTYRSCQKHESQSPCFHWSPFWVVLFITILNSKLCTALTTQNTTENNCTTLHAQNTSALQSHVFLTRVYRLLVTNKGRSAFAAQTTGKFDWKLLSQYKYLSLDTA